MGTKLWILTALSGIGFLGIVFGYPLTHSPRYDVLEPYVRQCESLSKFKDVAAANGLPYEISEVDSGRYICLTFPLDGWMTGQSVELHFERLTGSNWGGFIVSRSGKKSQFQCCKH